MKYLTRESSLETLIIWRFPLRMRSLTVSQSGRGENSHVMISLIRLKRVAKTRYCELVHVTRGSELLQLAFASPLNAVHRIPWSPLLYPSVSVTMATPVKRKAAEAATSTAKKPKVNASITSFFSSPAGPAKPAASASDAISSSPATAVEDSSQKSNGSPTTVTTASIFGEKNAAPSAASAAPLPKFDKQKWVDKLTPEQKDLLKLEIQTLDETWLAQLKDDITSKDFLSLKRFLREEQQAGKKVFPPNGDIYSWSVSIVLIEA